MAVIHKHPITIPICTITLPEGAELLDIKTQSGEQLQPVAWFLVPDVNAPPQTRKFMVAPTSQDINVDGMTYRGTFQLATFVGHVFELDS